MGAPGPGHVSLSLLGGPSFPICPLRFHSLAPYFGDHFLILICLSLEDPGFFTLTSHWLSVASPTPVSGSGPVGFSPQQVHMIRTINIGTLLGGHCASGLGGETLQVHPSS